MKQSTPLKARATAYKGIAMRSRTEALFAAALDRADLEWLYEPQAFANEDQQYLPDFMVEIDDGSTLFVEVKGAYCNVRDVLERMRCVLDSVPDASLAVAFQGTPEHLTMVSPGFAGLARWCRWTADGREIVGPFPILAFSEAEEFGAPECIEDEALLALIWSFRLGIDDVEPMAFDWQWH